MGIEITVLPEARELMDELEPLKVFDPEVNTYEEATAASLELAKRKKQLKQLEELRLSAVRPINAAIDSVNAMFAKPKQILQGLIAAYSGAISTFERAERKKREAEAEAAAEREKQRLITAAANALKAGNEEAVKVLVGEIKSVVPIEIAAAAKVEGSYQKKKVVVKVVNPDLVPRQFLEVSEKALLKHGRTVLKLSSRLPEVPGVVFEIESITVTDTRRLVGYNEEEE